MDYLTIRVTLGIFFRLSWRARSSSGVGLPGKFGGAVVSTVGTVIGTVGIAAGAFGAGIGAAIGAGPDSLWADSSTTCREESLGELGLALG